MPDNTENTREPAFGFRPGGSGLTRVLGELEAEIMELVWSRGRASVRDIHDTLVLRRSIAYTTVMTTMSRLHDKGLLARQPEGKHYLYAPALTREEFAQRVAGSVIDGLLEDFSRPALAHLVERLGEADEARLSELEELIRRRRAALSDEP